jgi:hypothetical protein
MKKLFNSTKKTLKNALGKIAGQISGSVKGSLAGFPAGGAGIKQAVTNCSGEGYVDSAVKILMAVVIGALLLAGLYKLFGDTVMPTLTERIEKMFDYTG